MSRFADHSKTEDTYELTTTSHSKAVHSPSRSSRRVPRKWSRTCVGWTFGVPIVVLALIIVIIFKVKAANRYPDYSYLDYKLVDVYQGETFFDKFDYFTG